MTSAIEFLQERSSPKKVLVIGGGSGAARAFRKRAILDPALELITSVRSPPRAPDCGNLAVIDDYFDPPAELLQWADVVINFAGIAQSRDEVLLQRVNVDGPKKLAEKAGLYGVRHFVQLSSFHVYGTAELVSVNSEEHPITPYGRSKLAADRALLALDGNDLFVTLLRLPMLYGPGVGRNLAKLTSLMRRAPFFPVRPTSTRRSIQHISNLACALQSVIRKRPRGICLSADPEPLSFEVLAEAIEDACGTKPKLMSLPNFAFALLNKLAGGAYRRLYQSCLVEQSECVELDTTSRIALRDGLKEFISSTGMGR